jgi:multiple sugar transport system substrate-binding protein
MRRTVGRAFVARVVMPVTVIGLVTACGGGGGGGGGGSTAGGASGGLDLAAVKPEQLKGQTIRLARFFGDCEDKTSGVTDVAKATDECSTIQILTNKFNAENKYGIKVERLGGAEWNQYYDTLNAAYAGGTAPDVAVMHGSSLPDYARRNLLVKLDDQVKVTGANLGDAAPAAREAISWQGGTYALPFDIHAALAHVNVDLFKKAGLVDAQGAPKMPTSTEEFLAQAQQMKARTGKNYFGAARVKDALGVHMWRSLVEQQGGSIMSQDLTKATVDTPQARTALDFMNKVFGPYADPNQTYDAAQAAFLAGDTAMLLNGTWVVDQYDKETKFDYRAMDFPTLYEKPAIWADSHTWAVPRQKSQDPVKTRAALEFVSFLYEHSGDWAIHTGHLAARQSVLNSPAYKQAPQRANYVATGTTNAHLVPHIANWKAINDAVVAQIDSVWFQGVQPETAFTQANQQLDAILAKK